MIKKMIVVLLLTGLCIAQPVPSDGEPAAKKAHHVTNKNVTKKNVTKTSPANAQPAASAEDVKELKEVVRALRTEVEQLKQQAAQHDQQAMQAVTDAQKTAAAAQGNANATAAAVAETNTKVDTVQSNVAGLTTTVNAAVVTVQKDEKRVAELEVPAYVHYKGIKLTPGGYIQLANIYRSHNANSDTSDNYGAFPLSGSTNSKLNEFRASGRASRLSLKAEGAANGMKFVAFFESDFLGAATTANESQTNSFTPRLRVAFGNVDLPGGWSISGGQNWSLLQTTRRGIEPLSEWLPSVIDNSYSTGFSYARQGSIRVTKAIGTKAWIAVAVENPETIANVQCLKTTSAGVTSSCTTAFFPAAGGAIQGLQNTSITASPNSGFSTATPSNDIAPDLVAKVAFEPGWGHYEVKAISRRFRDRVSPTFNATPSSNAGSVNRVTQGGALGFAAILPIIPKKLDVELQGLGGKGIGRFGTTGAPDVTVRPDGLLVPVKGLQAIIGIEAHPTPKFDINIYVGDEYYGRSTYTATGLFGAAATTQYLIGYGGKAFLDGGCSSDPTGTCMSSNQNRSTWTVQPGLWYRLYKGKQGTVQFGAFYSYTHRQTWSGVASGTSNSPVSPLAIENIAMTSFRYYLP